MNIVHIIPSAPYNEGWGYQDNLLPKYHSKMENNVTVITTTREHGDGKIVKVKECRYRSKDGFDVVRRRDKFDILGKLSFLLSYEKVYDLLKDIRPDFIFFHGMVSITIFQAIKYKKKINPNVVIVQDNHLDYNIGFDPSKSLKYKFYQFVFRMYHKLTRNYISKVYGVTPWRKTYAERVFGVSPLKADVLIMGADDEKIHFEQRDVIRNAIRSQYDIKSNEFLVVTGGKIDAKKKIDVLMKSVRDLLNVKLLVFGSIAERDKSKIDSILKESNNIVYVGWIDADKVYDYFFAADLVLFPGQHSVLWEQACASKVPCVFEKWEGMEHVNNGGNADFVFPVTVETLKAKIEELKFTPKYFEMKAVAESRNTDIFLYSKIAEKSLECVK